MKPHWQTKHDWWLEDMRFDMRQIWAFKLLLRKHPCDDMTDTFKSLIKATQAHLKGIVAGYQRVYAHKPNIRKMRAEIEKET